MIKNNIIIFLLILGSFFYNIKSTEENDIYLFNLGFIGTNSLKAGEISYGPGFNIDRICQYSTSQQGISSKGGGRLSCGYHALKNGLIILDGLLYNWPEEKISKFLKSEAIVKGLFGNSNKAKWIEVIKNKNINCLENISSGLAISYLGSREMTLIIKDHIEHYLGGKTNDEIDINQLNSTVGDVDIRFVFIGDMISENLFKNNVEEEFKREFNFSLNESVRYLRDENKKDLVVIILSLHSDHWHSIVVHKKYNNIASIYLADSFNKKDMFNDRNLIQLIKILNPTNIKVSNDNVIIPRCVLVDENNLECHDLSEVNNYILNKNLIIAGIILGAVFVSKKILDYFDDFD